MGYRQDSLGDFNNAKEKVPKIKKLINKGEYDEDVDRYITLDLKFQGILENVTTKGQIVHLSYTDMENQEFEILLTQNDFTNLNSFVLPYKNKKIYKPKYGHR